MIKLAQLIFINELGLDYLYLADSNISESDTGALSALASIPQFVQKRALLSIFAPQ